MADFETTTLYIKLNFLYLNDELVIEITSMSESEVTVIEPTEK